MTNTITTFTIITITITSHHNITSLLPVVSAVSTLRNAMNSILKYSVFCIK